MIDVWYASIRDLGGGWGRALLALGVTGIAMWAAWHYRATALRRERPVRRERPIERELERPIENDFRTSTSVVVPSAGEDPGILLCCLHSWLAQDPSEIIVVPEVGDVEVIKAVIDVGDPRVRVLPIQHTGARSALGVGVHAARGEVIVVTDSGTSWQPGLLEAVQMPFADSRVGAVVTEQSVPARTSGIVRRIADRLVKLRKHDVHDEARSGAAPRAPEHTSAYRRSVVVPAMTRLENELPLGGGRECVAADGDRLTRLVLASGYRSVFQASARAVSVIRTASEPSSASSSRGAETPAVAAPLAHVCRDDHAGLPGRGEAHGRGHRKKSRYGQPA